MMHALCVVGVEGGGGGGVVGRFLRREDKLPCVPVALVIHPTRAQGEGTAAWARR